jgi:hypothetical protein
MVDGGKFPFVRLIVVSAGMAQTLFWSLTLQLM